MQNTAAKGNPAGSLYAPVRMKLRQVATSLSAECGEAGIYNITASTREIDLRHMVAVSITLLAIEEKKKALELCTLPVSRTQAE